MVQSVVGVEQPCTPPGDRRRNDQLEAIDEVGAEQRTGEADAAVNADVPARLTLEGAYVVDGRGCHFDGVRPVVLERTRREDVLGRRVDERREGLHVGGRPEVDPVLVRAPTEKNVGL